MEMVDGFGRVDFRLKGTRQISRLRALDDVEVVVGGVAAGVAFGADGGAWMML